MSSISPSPALAKKKKIMIPAIIGGAILLNEALKNKKKKGYRAHKNKMKRKLRKNAKGLPEKRLSKKEVRLVQERLNILNYNVGNPDGILGKGTRNGIKQYQAEIGEERTGYLTEYEFETLLSETSEFAQNEMEESDKQAQTQIIEEKKQTRTINYKPQGQYDYNLNGVWSGTYICGSFSQEALKNKDRFEITFKQSGNNLKAVFSFKTYIGKKVISSGTLMSEGTFDPTSGNVNIEGDHWLQKPKRGYFVPPLTGKYTSNTDQLSLSFTQQKCRVLTVKRSKYLEMYQDPWNKLNYSKKEVATLHSQGLISFLPEIFSASEDKLARYWEGRLRCSKGLKLDRDLTLDVTRQGRSRYRAMLSVYYPWSSDGQTSWDFFIGEHEKENNTYFFARTREKLHGLDRVNVKSFHISDLNNKSIKLVLGDKRCSPINLTPITKADLVPLVRLSKGNRGSFYEARGAAAKCKALIKWGNLINENFPNSKNRNWAVLFTDRNFIPVFGRPYANFSEKMRKNFNKANRKLIRFCGSDPLINAKFQNADDAFRKGFGYGWRHVGYLVRFAEINRKINHRIIRLEQELNTSDYDNNTFNRITSLVNLVKENNNIIVPTELASIKKRLNKLQFQIAKGLAFKGYDELVAEKNPLNQLEMTSKFRITPPEYVQYLAPIDKTEINNRYAAISQQLSQNFLKPLVTKIEQTETSFEGIQDIQQLYKHSADLLKKVDGTEKVQFENTYKEKRKQIINELVDRKFSSLISYPNNQKGIADSEKWLKNFEADFSSFKKFESVKNIKNKYDAFRSKQILSSYNDFEHHLKNLNKSSPQISEEITNLVKHYLTTQSDYNRPVSLEYLFASEAFKANSPEKRDSKKISKNDQAGLNNKNKVLKVIDDGLDVLDVGLDDLEKDIDKLEQEVEELKKEKRLN